MNLLDLATNPLYDQLLKDGNWQQADAYDFSTDSIFWNKACVITLAKAFAKTPTIALLYLLQKETQMLGIWEQEWGNETPTASEFIHYFIAERGFTNTQGVDIEIEKFWQKYTATITGITAADGFEFCKNEVPQQLTDILIKEEIVQAICFDDIWDEQNFLIETQTQWVLFHWSSAA